MKINENEHKKSLDKMITPGKYLGIMDFFSS